MRRAAKTDAPVEFDLPYPPSVNNLYATFKGRRILSREGRAYQGAVAAVVGKVSALAGKVGYMLWVHPPDKRRRDLSNTIKAVEDALTKAGVWEDDSQVDFLHVERREPVKGGRVSIRVTSMEEAIAALRT